MLYIMFNVIYKYAHMYLKFNGDFLPIKQKAIIQSLQKDSSGEFVNDITYITYVRICI